MRVTAKVEEPKVSTEERLKIVEGQLGSVQGELSMIRQMLSKLVEKGAEGSPNDPLTKGDILDAVMVESSLAARPSVQDEGDQGSRNQEGSGDKDEAESQGGDKDGGEDEGDEGSG